MHDIQQPWKNNVKGLQSTLLFNYIPSQIVENDTTTYLFYFLQN